MHDVLARERQRLAQALKACSSDHTPPPIRIGTDCLKAWRY